MQISIKTPQFCPNLYNSCKIKTHALNTTKQHAMTRNGCIRAQISQIMFPYI